MSREFSHDKLFDINIMTTEAGDNLNSTRGIQFQEDEGVMTKRQESQGPQDKRYIVRITMYLFGISCLLPWNFFIQANDYWMFKFRNTTLSSDDHDVNKITTTLQKTFSVYLAIASKVPYVLFLLANTAVAARIRPEKRIQYPLAVMILLFVAVVIMAPINTDNKQQEFFIITMCIVVAINVMCGFFQGGGTGIAGCFPKNYMGYNVNGMAIGGILASAAQILSLVADSSQINSAIFYFVCALVILLVTFTSFLIAIRTEFYQFYMSKQASSKATGSRLKNEGTNISRFEIFKKIKVYAAGITVLFWVTLSVLPALFVLINSTSDVDSLWTGRLFIPVACFFLFNFCDLGGRLLGSQITIPSKFCYLTLALTISRVIFVPLFMLCNANPRTNLPVLFGDASFIVLIFFFAVTNGYLCNIILTQAPKKVEEHHQELAGTQMAFFLGLGLGLGACSSYAIVALL